MQKLKRDLAATFILLLALGFAVGLMVGIKISATNAETIKEAKR